ncbi:MAG TPA: exosortase-associated EpsI family protein [Tepidisphaeraceae bacterium]
MADKQARNFLTVGLSLALLGGAGIDRSLRTMPADTEPYHQAIQQVASRAPMRIGDWMGYDEQTPESAIKLLHPNVIVSKRYLNYVTGEGVDFLLVDCTDARDLQGHYPPVCYPNQGWLQMSAEKHDWQVGDLKITGMQYDFMKKAYDQEHKTLVDTTETVANFMLLPNHQIGRDMDSVRAVAKNLQDRYYGAAQVQVITDASLPQERKDQIVEQFAGAYQDLIKAIINGGKK